MGKGQSVEHVRFSDEHGSLVLDSGELCDRDEHGKFYEAIFLLI